jgi:hypothetical protein
MTTDYVEDDLPGETITVNDTTWHREKFDTDGYQWVREMRDDEYDWDRAAVSLVGTDVPIRVVSLQFLGGEWAVEGSETAGPNYHRPGFTELISSEYTETFEDAESAFRAVEEYVQELS